MKYGIVIFPSKELQDRANALRKRYDPNYTLIPPHITLKYPFDMDETHMDGVVQELKQIASDNHPFSLTIGNVSSFYPLNHVIYFKVSKPEELFKLNEQMYIGPLATDRDYPFVPHITIGQYLSTDEHGDVYGRLKMRDYRFEEFVDRFHLLYQLENGSWTVHETFHLGKDN